MKKLIQLFFLLNLVSSLAATKEVNGPRYDTGDIQLLQSKFEKEQRQKLKIQEYLKRVKLEIVRGNLDKAKVLLTQAKYTQNFSKPIQYRYLALVHFLKDEHKKVVEILDSSIFADTNYRSKTCLIKTMSLMATNEYKKAESEWLQCKIIAATDQASSFNWLTLLAQAPKSKNQYAQVVGLLKGLNAKTKNTSEIKFYMKMALYFDLSEVILGQIKKFNFNILQDREIRELIGFMYYRQGKLRKAMSFLENIPTNNTENIKGNIYLMQKKYELAYAQYKVALTKKSNSQNALMRIIPLAWKLKQWDEGLNYTFAQVDHRNSTQQLQLQAAFLTQTKRYKKSNDLLKYIIKRKRGAQSWLVNILASLNSLILKDNEAAKNFARSSCIQGNGLSCIYQYHFVQWNNFSQIIASKQEVPTASELLSFTDKRISQKIDEKAFVSQRYLIELDRKDGEL